MCKWKYSLVLSLCLLLPALPGRSEEVTIRKDEILTLQQAIAIARQQNRGVLAVQQRVQAAQARVREARGSLLPQLSISVTGNRTEPLWPASPSPAPAGLPGIPGLPNFDALTGKTSQSLYSAQATLSQPLFTGFRLINGLKTAESGLDAAQEEERGVLQDVALNVTLAYFNVLRAQGGLEIAQEGLRAAEAHWSDAKKAFQAGVRTKLEVLQAETKVYDLRQQVSRAQLALTTAKNGLNILLFRDLSEPVNLDSNSRLELSLPGLEEARDKARSQRTEIRRLQSLHRIDELTAAIQDGATWPSLALFATVQHTDANVSFFQKDVYQFGVNVQWNIFDGLVAASKAAQSRASARQDLLNLEQLRRSVAAEVEQSLLEIEEARGRIAVAQKGLELARESLRLANRRYQAGVGTQTEVLDANVALIQAENNLNNARFDWNVAQAKFKRALGED